MFTHARSSYYITLRSDADRHFFPANTPMSFANRLRELVVVDPPMDFEVALCDLHLERVRLAADTLVSVRCSIAAKSQIGEQADTFLRLLRLDATPLRPNPARKSPDDAVSYANVPRYVNEAAPQSYSFVRPQYVPLSTLQQSPIDAITLEITPLDGIATLHADAVAATLHVRRRKNAETPATTLRMPTITYG